MSLFNNDFKNLKGYQWAKQVVDGKFIANKYVKLECERYINRLENLQNDKEFPFYFSMDEAEIVFGLTQFLNFPTGFFANEPIYPHLAGFQAMVIENVFCWFAKEVDENGIVNKMIEEVYLEVGRKSSKSFLCSLLEVLIMLRSTRFAQHGLGGKTREISSIVKQATTELIKSSPLISKYFKITRDKITCLLNECTLKAFAGESNNINGLLLTSFIVDEVANQETQEIIGALKLSQMSVKGSRLSIYISTQYDLEINAFNELIDYHKKVLDGLTEEEPLNMFGLLFELDAGDDYTDPQNWWKASPLQMGFENGRKFLMGEFKKGLEVPSTMREFRIKILNQRLSGDISESFVPLEDLRKGELEEPFNWNEKEVYWGVDLSVSDDSCSISMVHYDEKEDKFYTKAWAFVPQDTLQQRIKIEKIDYVRMIENGYAYACGDRIISYQFIEELLISITKKYNLTVKGIGYDRFNAISSANKWNSEGLETIEVRQHSTILNGGTKLMKESILQNRFFYEQNRLLENHFMNARTMLDTNLNAYLNKKRSRGKIDMVAATLNAFVLWNKDKEEGDSIYESRDFVIL